MCVCLCDVTCSCVCQCWVMLCACLCGEMLCFRVYVIVGCCYVRAYVEGCCVFLCLSVYRSGNMSHWLSFTVLYTHLRTWTLC